MSFNACAIELYSEIMKYADRASLLSSACVSKTFASEVRRHLYHTIDVSSLAAENEKPYRHVLSMLSTREDIARHVRVVKVAVYDRFTQELLWALPRLKRLRHFEASRGNTISADYHRLRIRADLHTIIWGCALRDEAMFVKHVGKYHPNLRELDFENFSPTKHGGTHININMAAAPIIPQSFPSLQSLRADWALVYTIIYRNGQHLVHLDIHLNEERTFVPSWLGPQLLALRYLRIRSLWGDELELRQRIVAQAPNLEYLMIPLKNVQFTLLDCLPSLRQITIDFMKLKSDDPIIAKTVQTFFETFDNSSTSFSVIVETPDSEYLKGHDLITYFRSQDPPTIQRVDYSGGWLHRDAL